MRFHPCVRCPAWAVQVTAVISPICSQTRRVRSLRVSAKRSCPALTAYPLPPQPNDVRARHEASSTEPPLPCKGRFSSKAATPTPLRLRGQSGSCWLLVQSSGVECLLPLLIEANPHNYAGPDCPEPG